MVYIDKFEWEDKQIICKGLKVDNDCVASITKKGILLGTVETWLSDMKVTGECAPMFFHTVSIVEYPYQVLLKCPSHSDHLPDKRILFYGPYGYNYYLFCGGIRPIVKNSLMV